MNDVPLRFPLYELEFENSPEFKYYSCFSSDSFGLCLAIGTLEILARFKGAALHFTEKMVHNLRNLISDRKNHFAGDESLKYIIYFEGVLENILKSSDSFSSYNYISDFSLINPGRNLGWILKGILLLITGMDDKNDQELYFKLINKITEGYEETILNMFCKSLGICIDVHTYEKVEYDRYLPMIIDIFPILHLIQSRNTYYLIYTQEMFDHQKGTNPDNQALTTIPYIMNLQKRSIENMPINMPQSLQLTFLRNSSHDLNLALSLLNSITSETKPYFSENLKNLIRDCKIKSHSINSVPLFKDI